MQGHDAAKSFLSRLPAKTKGAERAIALLWFAGRDHDAALKSSTVCSTLEQCGFGQQNQTRTEKAFRSDRRLTKDRSGGYRIRPDRLAELDSAFGPMTLSKPKAQPSSSAIDMELFKNARPYVYTVAYQINGSYDAGLYDCTAVMCRRMLETLMIETCEVVGCAERIKGADGHFLMFAGLLKTIESENLFPLSRNGLQSLRDFKRLGDLSAHNRFFLAKKKDIDDVRHGLRTATEELLHRCKQA
jgi:hypothetical protein